MPIHVTPTLTLTSGDHGLVYLLEGLLEEDPALFDLCDFLVSEGRLAAS
jgi:hypothetical protein